MSNGISKHNPGIVGAAIVPHAPQFLTLPKTEDKAQVARFNAALHRRPLWRDRAAPRERLVG
jgi:hypothetical protein